MANFKSQISNLRSTAQWIIYGLLLGVIVCGCRKKSEPENAVAQASGQLRIIAMAPNLTEILFSLGLDEQIVGVTKFSTFPERAKTKPSIGSFWQPDIEAVVACKPTLVITLGFGQQTALAKRLKQIGCETLTVNIESINDLFSAIETIGTKVDRAEQADLIVQRLRKQMDTLNNHNAGRSDRPKVLWVVQRQPLRVAGTKTFVNDLIEIAGGINAIGDTINVYPPISTEELIGSMPDVIIEPAMDMDCFDEQQSNAQEFYQGYAVIPAVQNKRIYIIDGDLVSRLGPRLDEGMELIAQCLWPKGRH